MTQIARVASCEAVRVAATHCNRFNLSFHELCRRQNVKLGVAPNKRVRALWDIIDRDILPTSLFRVVVLQLYLAIYQEFEYTKSCLSCANRIFAELKFDAAFIVKVDWISQIKVNEDIGDYCLVRLQGCTCARPWQAFLILVKFRDTVTMNLAAGLHPQWHCIAILSIESKRAHCTIYA